MPGHWWDDRRYPPDPEPSWLWTALLALIVLATLLAVAWVVAT